MSKSVLIIDTPECCSNCSLMTDSYDNGYCSAHDDDYIDIPDITGGKPDWCPLRELPEKRPEKMLSSLRRYGATTRFKVSDLNIGWNACLDAITGEVHHD